MVWGAIFGGGGHGPLHFVPQGETVNTKKYLDILEEKLKIWMEIHGCKVFQHDGAPCHRAKPVTGFKSSQWLQENEVAVLAPRPRNSPDLNIIENCWTIVKKEVAATNPRSDRT